MPWLAILLIGAAVGFLGGMFGKGGSAIATPLLAAAGVPALVAVASPLPATIPALVVAYLPYRRLGFEDRRVLAWTIGLGAPAAAAGALVTRFVGGGALVTITEAVIVVLGVRILLRPQPHELVDPEISHQGWRLAVVALTVGFVAGLLANAGGFLLVPLYLAVLRLPIKTALAGSLAASAVLAVPSTLVHAALGHIDWSVTIVFALASVPLANLGARVALRTRPERLERWYGTGLTLLGLVLLARSLLA